jgi:hypothetical protein
VGDYDLTGYKNFAKASETNFVIPEKLTNITGSGDKRMGRAKSAMHRPTRSDLQSHKSRSPNRTGGIYENLSTKRLGGPQHPNTNYMMQASRFQRTLLFTWEGDSANLNKLGQGPAAYDTTTYDRENIGKKYAFTMPKVSKYILFDHFELQSDRNITMTSKERKTPIAYCHPDKQLSIMKK